MGIDRSAPDRIQTQAPQIYGGAGTQPLVLYVRAAIARVSLSRHCEASSLDAPLVEALRR